MNAIIFYEDVAAAINAKMMFECAAHRADQAVQWIIKPWRLDMLKLPAAADMALRDASDAALILFGLRDPRLLPSFLRNWLEQWAVRRQVQSAALAVLDAGKGHVLAKTVAPELSHFAKRNGLSFIFSDPGWKEEEWPLFAQAGDVQPIAAPNEAPPLPIYYHRQGINE